MDGARNYNLSRGARELSQLLRRLSIPEVGLGTRRPAASWPRALSTAVQFPPVSSGIRRRFRSRRRGTGDHRSMKESPTRLFAARPRFPRGKAWLALGALLILTCGSDSWSP